MIEHSSCVAYSWWIPYDKPVNITVYTIRIFGVALYVQYSMDFFLSDLSGVTRTKWRVRVRYVFFKNIQSTFSCSWRNCACPVLMLWTHRKCLVYSMKFPWRIYDTWDLIRCSFECSCSAADVLYPFSFSYISTLNAREHALWSFQWKRSTTKREFWNKNGSLIRALVHEWQASS